MRKVVLFPGMVIMLLGILAGSALADDFATKPRPRPGGGKWRIAYVQGGDYKDYLPVTLAVLRGLADLGWVKLDGLPEFQEEQGVKPLWDWLASHPVSEYLEFVADAYYNSDWDETTRPQVQKKLLDRLGGAKDIDLIWALGTWAGQDLANDQNTVNTVVFSSSDPLASNIVKSVEDSGRDNLWARLDPTRYDRQVTLFHEIIGFKKLGIVFEDTAVGRSYCSLDRIQAVSQKLGFELVPCHATFSDINSGEAARQVAACHDKLGTQVDAIYVTNHRGVSPKSMELINQPLLAHKLPSFSQAGSQEVRYGLLMSISQANFKYVGEFYATTVAKVLNGAKPRQLPQIFESPPKIAINLATAEKIGYDPPVDILMAADEIYETIAKAPPTTP